MGGTADGRRAGGEDRSGLGARRAVDITAIERELAAMWDPATEDAGAGDEPAVTRACTNTLIVYTEDQAQAEHASRVIAQVAQHDPCRAIVITASPSAPDAPPAAWISANCYLPGPASAQVCCEQINITAQGSAVAQLPGLVLPLLVSDLPVVVWWHGDAPLDNPIFARFASTADRIVLDSAGFSHPCRGLARLSRLVRGPFAKAAFSDLNWARLTSWRDLTAQFFDSPVARQYLLSIDAVTAEYGAHPDARRLNRAQAALLVGWLASRLGWSAEPGCPMDGGRDCLRCLRGPGGEPIRVAVRAVAPDSAAEGEIVALRLHASGEPGATFTITAADAGNCVRTIAQIDGKPPVTRMGRIGLANDTQLLCQELEVAERDHVFEESLAFVGILAGNEE